MDLKSTSPSVTAGLPFTTIEGTPDGAPLKVAFILDPTLRPFQIQGFSLTMGIRVALQGFQIDCSADVLKKIRIGWVQTCEPNRQVEIRLPNGQSRTWVRTSLPFKDGSSVGLESPWYTEPWYPSQETYQAIYNSLAPGIMKAVRMYIFQSFHLIFSSKQSVYEAIILPSERTYRVNCRPLCVCGENLIPHKRPLTKGSISRSRFLWSNAIQCSKPGK